MKVCTYSSQGCTLFLTLSIRDRSSPQLGGLEEYSCIIIIPTHLQHRYVHVYMHIYYRYGMGGGGGWRRECICLLLLWMTRRLHQWSQSAIVVVRLLESRFYSMNFPAIHRWGWWWCWRWWWGDVVLQRLLMFLFWYLFFQWRAT